MRRVRIVFGLLLLLSAIPTLAQGTYYVDYYANNAGAVVGPADQTIKILNVGTTGTPLTSPVGDVCASFYVFDSNQEMLACCPCRLTPNELASTSVGFRLTNNTVTSVVPPSGVIKIALTPAPAGGCDPTAPLTGADASLGVVTGTHVQVTGGFVFVAETEKHHQTLSANEAAFLPQACSFALYLGSGRGTCSCLSPGR
jgi:hypothetical protein